MKQALITALAIWIATIAAYYWGLRFMIEWPGNLLCAILGGTFLVAFIGSVRGWLHGRADAALVRQALAGQPLQNGRRAAVAGRLMVTGTAISSPVSGKLCALYQYDVEHEEEYTVQGSDNTRETRSRSVVDFTGAGMAPCVVEGQRGRIGLSGFPILEAVEGNVLSSAAALHNLSRHLESHPPKSSTGLAKLRGLGELAGALSHDTSALQMDWRFTKAPLGADGQTVTEKRIESGESVVVIGRYDEEKRALVGRDGRKASYNLLHLGSPDEVSRQIQKGGILMVVVTFLFFAVFHGAMAFVLQHTAHSADDASKQEATILGLAQSGDGMALREYVKRHGTPGTAGPVLTRLLCDARSPERARILLDAGADPNAADPRTGDPPLMAAVRFGNLETVDLLLKRGANPHIEEARTRHPLLFVAYMLRRFTVIPRLEKEGLKETWVTSATGQDLPAGGGEPFAVCAQYLAAVQREDVATMAKLTSRNTGTTYQGVNFEVWKKSRPTHPRFLGGYFRAHPPEAGATQSATLTLLDPDPALAFLTWNYHLLYEDGKWKIYAEWSNP